MNYGSHEFQRVREGFKIIVSRVAVFENLLQKREEGLDPGVNDRQFDDLQLGEGGIGIAVGLAPTETNVSLEPVSMDPAACP